MRACRMCSSAANSVPLTPSRSRSLGLWASYDPTSRYPCRADECSARTDHGHRSGASALRAGVLARLAAERARPGQLCPGCLPRRHCAEDPGRGDEPAAGRAGHAREQARAPRHPGAGPRRRPGRAGRSGGARSLRPARRRRAAPVATAHGEVSHERGTRHGPAPGPQGRDLRPSVQPAPGADQPGEPAPAVRAPPARPRARLAGGQHRGDRRRPRLERGGAAHRRGFKDLIARVTLGEVGIVLSSEVTRLARNCSDWYPLLDLCGCRACLIADRDGVYDSGSLNGRLLLGLKGTMSELELHLLRGRLTAGLLSKAARGELALQLPAGLVRDADGRVTKDPDREVRDRLAPIFATFLEQGSVAKVMKSFKSRQLAVPRRDRFGEVAWRAPTTGMLGDILKNPAYAGAFVYGRTRSCHRHYAGGKLATARCPVAEWKIVVRDKYPAYLDWDSFERVQAMLRDNHAEYVRNRTRGVPRDGAALLQGIVWCGECGHKMAVQYKAGNRYVCNPLHATRGEPVCQHLPADPIDAEVVAAFFAAVIPAELEAWARADDDRRRAEAALDRAEGLQVERLR